MAHWTGDATRVSGGHAFENVTVDGHGTAILGDHHVHNHSEPSAEEQEKIARRGKMQAPVLDKHRVLT